MVTRPNPPAVALAALALFVATAPTPSRAQPAPPPPSGLRVFTCAHSFHAFVYPQLAEVAKLAGIADHQSVGTSRIGGSRVIQHWDVPDAKNEAKKALTAGNVDVLTLSPIWLPDEGIEKFAALGVAHNPNIRVTVQEFWLPNDTYEPKYPLDTRKKVDHDATNLAELKEKQAKYDHDMDEYCRAINQKLGKDIIVTVPVGQAAIALREKITAGQAFGLKKQSDLFRDNWGHPQPPLQLLDTYCHYALIYKRSPVGLPMPSALTKPKNPAYDESLNHLLQQLAWEAVTHHPMSGVEQAK